MLALLWPGAGLWEGEMARIADRLSLGGIVAVALILRVAWALWIPVAPYSDPGAYLAMAENLLNHGVYGFEPDVPSGQWPPGTSAVYAALFFVAGSSPAVIAGFNIAVSLANVLLTWAVGREIGGGRAGLVAAAIMAVWPQMIFFVTIPASEPLFIAALLLSALMWRRATGAHWGYAVTAGLFLAAAAYLRSVALLFPLVFLAAALLTRACPPSHAVARIVILCLAMAAAIAPWTYRNYQVFDAFVLISANFGSNLHIGNRPGGTGRFQEGGGARDDGADMNQADASRAMGREAAAIILDDPARFLRLSLQKLILTHDRETIGVAWNAQGFEGRLGGRGETALKVLATGYWYAVLAATALSIGALLVFGPRAGLALPLLAWAYFAGIHAVVLAGDRFHMPSTPFMAVIIGLAVAGYAARAERAIPPPSPKPT